MREGPVFLILRLTWSSGDAPSGHSGARLDVAALLSTCWCCLGHWGQPLLVGKEWKWLHPALLSPYQGALPTTPQEALKKKQSPLLCPWLLSDPCLPSMSELSTCQVVQPSWVLSYAQLCFEGLNFRDPRSMTLYWYSGGVFRCTVASAGLSQKMVTWQCSGSEFMENGSTKLTLRFAAHSQCLCSHVPKYSTPMALAGCFVPGKAVSFLPNSLQAEELLLPVWPMGSSNHFACYHSLPSFPQGAL